MVRLDTETNLITHAIRMAASNAEVILARARHGHYARAGEETAALIREALTTSGDIIPCCGEPLVRLDPSPRRAAPVRWSPSATSSTPPPPLPWHRPHPALRGQDPVGRCINDLPASGVLRIQRLEGQRAVACRTLASPPR